MWQLQAWRIINNKYLNYSFSLISEVLFSVLILSVGTAIIEFCIFYLYQADWHIFTILRYPFLYILLGSDTQQSSVKPCTHRAQPLTEAKAI